jgi:2-C-methyl-D-erythritol 4-phosphate cytidylyltransferase/2-C-methyl-D-erythritol 2,4-cyclodiphosphate synthase
MPVREAAILVAAGFGTRAGGEIPKQYRKINGIPLIRLSLERLLAASDGQVVVVVHADHQDLFRKSTDGLFGLRTVFGGAQRTESVAAGLEALTVLQPDTIFIHDAARPGLTPPVMDRLRAALEHCDGAAPALPVSDALKEVQGADVVADVARGALRRVQTPQAFRFAPLLEAYRRLPAGAGFEDDLAVARAAGLRVCIVDGDPRLEKVTFPEDFGRVAHLLELDQAFPRVGNGFDAHRFGPGDHVTLCGVAIPHQAGLIGHSDADVAWHALTDAILGALGAGDIGDHFPPSDPQWRGAASQVFLARAVALAAKAGLRIVHVDMTLMCEAPRIKPHREAMRVRTAEVLGLPLERVSVKATTTERMGFLGREEGLAAFATATLL